MATMSLGISMSMVIASLLSLLGSVLSPSVVAAASGDVVRGAPVSKRLQRYRTMS